MRELASQPLGHGTQLTFLSQMIFGVHILFFLLPGIVESPPTLKTGNSHALVGEGAEAELPDAAYFLIELPILIM